MTTRRQLIELIKQIDRTYVGREWFNNMADSLIKEKLVVVEEEKKEWLLELDPKGKVHAIYDEKRPSVTFLDGYRFVNVHDVSSCNQWRSKWEKLREGMKRILRQAGEYGRLGSEDCQRIHRTYVSIAEDSLRESEKE